MTSALFVSSIFLAFLLGVRHFEHLRGKGRYFELARTRLDRLTHSFFLRIVKLWKKTLVYIHRDIFLNGLHMLTYVALVSVRFLENKLERVTIFLRSFKKDEKREKTTSGLRSIVRKKKEQKN